MLKNSFGRCDTNIPTAMSYLTANMNNGVCDIVKIKTSLLRTKMSKSSGITLKCSGPKPTSEKRILD